MRNNYYRKSIKKVLRWLAALAAIAVLCLGALYAHIIRYGLVTDNGDADAIIVLGAAVWPSGPSPALRARVWRGTQLLQAGRAGSIIFTGGLGRFPPAEGEAMAVLARSWDVPDEKIFIENRSANTRENMAFAAAIMRENGWGSALVVTDYFHMKRAVLLAREYGIQPLRAPVSAETGYYVLSERIRYTLRECAALIQYAMQKITGKLLPSGVLFFTEKN